jgi:hypothetical protein
MSYSLPKNTFTDLLSQPTVVAILASVGIHGLVGISWDRLPFSGNEPNPWTTVDLVNLTPEEISRLPDFSSPQATGAGTLNLSSGPLGSLPELGPLPPPPSGSTLDPLTLPPGTPLYNLPFDLPPAPSLGDLKTPLPSLQDYQSPNGFRDSWANPQFSRPSNSMAIEELLALERLERTQIDREIVQRERQRQAAIQNRQITPPPPPQEFRLQDVPPPPMTPMPAPPDSIDQEIALNGMNQQVDPSRFFDIPYREESPRPELSNLPSDPQQAPSPDSNLAFDTNELPYGVNPGMGPDSRQTGSDQLGGAADLVTQPRNSQESGIDEGSQAVVTPNIPSTSDRPGEGSPIPPEVKKTREVFDRILGQNKPENPTGLVSDRQNAMLEGSDAYIQWVANLGAAHGELSLKSPISVTNQYPEEACPQKLEGLALFGVLVSPEGQIMEAPRRLLPSGHDVLDGFARNWVQTMKFTPSSEPTVYQYAFEFQPNAQVCSNATGDTPAPTPTPAPPVETPQPQLDAQPAGDNQPPQLDAQPAGDNQPPQLDAQPAGNNQPPQLDAQPAGEASPNPSLSIPPASSEKPPTLQEVQPQAEEVQPVESPLMGEKEDFTPDGFETAPGAEPEELPSVEETEAELLEFVEGTSLEPKVEAEDQTAETEAEEEADSSEAIADEDDSDGES